MKPPMPAQDVIDMRWERKRGALLREIAKKYGLDDSHVSHIVTGQLYMHIGGPITGPKTHCIKGHEYAPDNTIIKANGGRNCRRCKNDQNNARRQGKRDATK